MLGLIILLPSLLAATTPAAAGNSGTSTGTWITLAAAVLAFLGTIIGIMVVRRTSARTNAIAQQAANTAKAAAAASKVAADQLDIWRQREETMRLMRWAADNAVKTEPVVADAGLRILEALQHSDLLQDEDKPFVRNVLGAVLTAVSHAVVAKPAAEIEDDDRVVQQ